MKILGVIAEYNPFHSGHAYHLNKSKELTGADAVIAVMSGDFVQRGEPAIVDKWARAEMAVRNGVDLVFELPFTYAVNSADYFAKGGVRLLDALGCVDYISFGSEAGELGLLDTAADILNDESDDFKTALKEGLDKGLSYPQARAGAVAAILHKGTADNAATANDCDRDISKLSADSISDLLKKSNNILAIEYLRQLKQIESTMKPVTVQRTGQDYNDSNYRIANKENTISSLNASELDNARIYNTFGTHGEYFASASAIRAQLIGNIDISTLNGVLSDETIAVFNRIIGYIQYKLNKNNLNNSVKVIEEKNSLSVDMANRRNQLFNMLRYEILKHSSEELAEIFAISEGIENRLKAAVRTAGSIDELIDTVISKRYTHTRIQRILIQLLVGIKRDDFVAMDRALDKALCCSCDTSLTGAAKELKENPLYARVLAFSDKGASIIKQIKKSGNCKIPIITNINKEAQNLSDSAAKLLDYDIKAADIYNLICGNDIYDCSDYVRTSFINNCK